MPHGSPEKQFLYHAFSFEKFKIKPFKHIVKLTKISYIPRFDNTLNNIFKKKVFKKPQEFVWGHDLAFVSVKIVLVARVVE